MTAPQSTDTERTLVINGFIEAVASVGYRGSSLEEILARAGIDEATFRRHFTDKEDCLAGAWDFIVADSRPVTMAAFASRDTWVEQIRVTGEALHRYLVEHPDRARILYVDGPVAGPRGRKRIEAAVDTFTELIDLGRQQLDDPDTLTRATAEGLAGAIFEQVSTRLQRGTPEDLSELVPQIMFTIVRPYLGLEAAMEELRR